jgi:hypothetical protein
MLASSPEKTLPTLRELRQSAHDPDAPTPPEFPEPKTIEFSPAERSPTSTKVTDVGSTRFSTNFRHVSAAPGSKTGFGGASSGDCEPRRIKGPLMSPLFQTSLLLMPRYFSVSLSENPGPFVEDDGPEVGVIVTEVNEFNPPRTVEFLSAMENFDLGQPRVSAVRPYLALDPFELPGWRTTTVGNLIFWTNCASRRFAEPPGSK